MIHLFHQHFQIVLANTPKLQQEVFKLRYRVFCQELESEPKSNHLDGMEQDIYDQHSVHCLLLHRASQQYAGCVRLILAEPFFPASLPFAPLCRYPSSTGHSSPSCLGELSRLTVAAEFRQRLSYKTKTERSIEDCNSARVEERAYPLIVPGLYMAAISIALELDLDAIYALMPPQLATYLQKFGMKLGQVEEREEIGCQRRLFEISREAILSSINASTYEVFQQLSSDIRKSWSQSQAETNLSQVKFHLHPEWAEWNAATEATGSKRSQICRHNLFQLSKRAHLSLIEQAGT
ncbi:MAG: PEP-CTERM/exosortase system-associated acyltransferase [Chroococcidiopsidaceae cyanobacterium CP_BM_ER_R8_30]|nr:PEP-CTERM/exosortase system-associated acyltransferase [Chroococcidiopsidaceae cyanobacterium CP_BM_ER_R8_30]